MIVEDDGPFRVARGAVYPYIALFLVLTQHPQSRFIRMQDLAAQQFSVQGLDERRKIVLMYKNHPVCHSLAGNGHSTARQFLFLPVERQSKCVFTVHDMGQQARRSHPAAWDQWSRHLAFPYWHMIARLLTMAAAVHGLYMLHHLILCGYIGQFTAQNLMAAGMQRLAALRADPLILRQFMYDLFDWQTGEVHFPFPLLLPTLVSDLLQFRSRSTLVLQRFRFIEQGDLFHGVYDRLCPLTGRAKTLAPHQPQLLGQPFHLPLQGSDLIFFFRKQLLPFGSAFLIRFHAVIIQEQRRKCNIFSAVPPIFSP